jgi:DNA-binding NarL/FixJ family response regulator
MSTQILAAPVTTAQVLIVDDHELFRAGLSAILSGPPLHCEVVGEAGDGETALQMIEQLTPHVVTMDLAMPGMSGIEATRQIHAAAPHIKVIILAEHTSRQLIAEAFKAGASGYLLKNSGVDELTAAVRAVRSPKLYMCPEVSDVMVQSCLLDGEPGPNGSAIATLSKREREVLRLLAEGRRTKEMAVALDLSIKTVEVYRGQIMTKLGLRSVAQLTKCAIREGLTSVET